MSATYTAARDRGRLRSGADPATRRHQALLLAVSLVSILAIGLAYSGRMRAFAAGEAQRGGQPTVNLAEVTTADALDAALTPAFERLADRRIAARELLRALGPQDTRAPLANVGALAAVTVPPTGLPLFSAADIAAIKPGVVVRDVAAHQRIVFWCAVAFLLAFQVVSIGWRLRGVSGDRILLAAAHLLATLGFVVMLSRPDPLRDGLLLLRYTQGVVVALGVCLAVSLVSVRTAAILRLGYVALAAAVGLSVVLMLFGSGPGASGAKVNLGPVQPIEAIRLLVVVFLAGYLGRRWELVRDVPRLDHMLPVFFGVGVSLLLFFALRDLGPALLLSLIFLAMIAMARARLVLVAAGVVTLVAGFYGGYWLGISKTLTARVAMWQSPWQNAVRGGDQVAHAAWAMAAGGLPGAGAGLGETRYLPAGHTDLVLAGVGEELGAIGMLVAVVAFGVIAWRGLRLARAASSDTAVFLAVGLTLSLVAPALVMAAGLLGLMPLTGVVTPFMSYGGSAMLINFAALGLLAAMASDRGEAADTTPFHRPLRWLGGALATGAAVLVVAWGRVQVVSADTVVIKPQLSVQADGGLRYQYNPRVLDAARRLPRGTVFDRRDVPLAADLRVVRAAEAELKRMQVSLRDVCPDPQARCYPLGGPAWHLLGDANRRANWSASNTAFVERDEEDRLRGFDDRAAAVRAEDDEGRTTIALRRDYRDLLPLIRHRWEPDHPDVRALTSRPRDLRLTIDARLQAHVAALVARFSASTGIERAAVVILDADSGELLASVSHPWPEGELEDGDRGAGATLDRARFGLYPPGSTFKLVTAAAALRQDSALSQVPFTCSTLPGGRVGVKIPGFGRPVRDDVLDTHAHGTLTMHDGVVRSCNAYFAQLAVRVGAPALALMAEQAGISYPTTGPPERVRENLPHSGYGQGQVLATPLRMARVAAAIASDGQIREPSIVHAMSPTAPKPFVSEDAARLLAGYMRDVVTDGTGRLLRNHPVHIAGKTGTAEVDAAKSHSWFVGFAPAGPATHRIAFAVLLENAGYGGAGAASVAGQVVTAAAALGLIK